MEGVPAGDGRRSTTGTGGVHAATTRCALPGDDDPPGQLLTIACCEAEELRNTVARHSAELPTEHTKVESIKEDSNAGNVN